MKRYRQLVLAATLAGVLVAVILSVSGCAAGWQSGRAFTGAPTAGHSVSPDGRWDLKLVWLEEAGAGGAPQVQLHLTDRDAARHFRRILAISDPEVDAANDEGSPRVHWIDDDYGPVASGTVRIGSEVVELPE